MQPPLVLGLVGAGRWGANIKRTLEELGSKVIVARKGEILEGIDGVCIATPSETHADVALPYLVRGIPTFIEKPMTTSSVDVRRIEDAVLRNAASLFIGHIYLYNPAFRIVVELSRTIGSIQSLTAEGANDTPRSDSLVIWDWLPHHLAMAREILGKNPVSVRVSTLDAHAVRDAAIVTYMFGIVPLESRVSWVASEKKRIVSIVGTDGTIVFDEMAPQKITLVKNGVAEHPEYDLTPPLTVELRAFLEMIRTRTTDRDHLRDASDIVRAIEAAEAAQPGSVLTIT